MHKLVKGVAILAEFDFGLKIFKNGRQLFLFDRKLKLAARLEDFVPGFCFTNLGLDDEQAIADLYVGLVSVP